jgi:hypothetical protein
MPESGTERLRFAGPAALPVEASFDGGRLTSDRGLVWLADADAALGLRAGLAACVPEWRRRPGRHSREALVRWSAWPTRARPHVCRLLRPSTVWRDAR